MTEVMILVEAHEGGWTATALDDCGQVAARTHPRRDLAVELVKDAARDQLGAGVVFSTVGLAD